MAVKQALKLEFFKDYKDLVEARFLLSIKLQEYGFKNKDFHIEKIIFTKKINWKKKEALNNSIINAHFHSSNLIKKGNNLWG